MRQSSAFRPHLVPPPDPAHRERRWASLLFFLTCCSVYCAQVWWWRPVGEALSIAPLTRAWWFTGSLMVVLLAHELGHYAVALHHGFRLSLPWFIPFPFFIGTLGAIIRLEAPPRGRTGLLEMGAAGPLAGFTAIVVLWSLRLAFGEAPNEVEGAYTLAAPWLWRVLGAMFAGSSTVPLSSADPVAFAGWIGCLVTAMNLLPIGQLDGGHIASALWPSWHQQVSYAVFAGLALLGFIWPGWWVWGLMIWLIGARHAVEVERPGPDVSRRAAWLAFGCAVCWVACFVPEPWAV